MIASVPPPAHKPLHGFSQAAPTAALQTLAKQAPKVNTERQTTARNASGPIVLHNVSANLQQKSRVEQPSHTAASNTLPTSPTNSFSTIRQQVSVSNRSNFFHTGPNVEKKGSWLTIKRPDAGDFSQLAAANQLWGTPINWLNRQLLKLANSNNGTLQWACLEEGLPLPKQGEVKAQSEEGGRSFSSNLQASLLIITPEQTKLGRALLGWLANGTHNKPITPFTLISCSAAPPSPVGEAHLKTLLEQTQQQLEQQHPGQCLYALVPKSHLSSFLASGFKEPVSTKQLTANTAEDVTPLVSLLQKPFETEAVRLLVADPTK